MNDFDYHREMIEALAAAPSNDPADMVWIMNAEHRARYRHFLSNVMGVDDDDSESFGIAIWTGEPSNGMPFELTLRPPN